MEVLETEGFFLQRRNGESFFAEEIRIQNESEKCRCDNVSQVNWFRSNLWLAVFKQDYKRLKTLWERIVEIGEKS